MKILSYNIDVSIIDLYGSLFVGKSDYTTVNLSGPLYNYSITINSNSYNNIEWCKCHDMDEQKRTVKEDICLVCCFHNELYYAGRVSVYYTCVKGLYISIHNHPRVTTRFLSPQGVSRSELLIGEIRRCVPY